MTAASETSDTAAQLAKSISALPPLPVTAQEILTCFGDEFIDADKVTAVVEGDPGICAKLLGLANSAYFGLAEPVNTMGEAVARVLGVDTVRSLVLAMAIQQSFNHRSCAAFDTALFWTQSLKIAECSKRIAMADAASDDTVRDLAYTTGLCHNLGLMALVHLESQRTNAVLEAHRRDGVTATLANRLTAEFATDHRIVTAELARFWSLPEPMLDAYQFRAFPQSYCAHRLGAVLAVAVRAVENADLDSADRVPLDDLANVLSLDVEELEDMAIAGTRQQERVESLASNMSR